MPRILAIECSTSQASVALIDEQQTFFEEHYHSDRRHNALIFEPLRRALDTLAGQAPDEIVVGTGPGSYSGVRVGIAAAQGISMVKRCPAVGLTSLLGLGHAAGTVIGDARRQSAWLADLSDPLPQAGLVDADALNDHLASSVLVLGSAANLKLPERTVPVEVTASAARLARAWLDLPEALRSELRRAPLQPIYLRPPHITRAKAGHPLLRRRDT